LKEFMNNAMHAPTSPHLFQEKQSPISTQTLIWGTFKSPIQPSNLGNLHLSVYTQTLYSSVYNGDSSFV